MAAISGFGFACIVFGLIGGQRSEVWVGLGCVVVAFLVRVVRALRIVDAALAIDTSSRLRVGHDQQRRRP